MVSPTFVLQAYTVKDDVTRRNVNFRQTKLRYFVVVLACLVVFGSEYCFDTPSALEVQIEQNYDHKNPDNHMTEPQFNLLYSLYSLPNIVVPLLGGILIDTKGPRIALLLSTFLCVLGHAIFGYGGFTNIWLVMLVGRFVFGLGGEVLHAAQNTIISRWFKATQLSVVLGICISFPKIGSSLNAVLSSKIGHDYYQSQKQGEYLNVGIPLLIALGLMIFSLFLAFLLAYYDRKTEKLQKIKHQSQILSSTNKTQYKTKSLITGTQKSEIQVRFLERTQIGADDKQVTEQKGGHLDLKAIKKLPITYWLLIIICMLSQSLFIPFLDNGNLYFLKVFKSIGSTQKAGMYLALPYVVSSFMVVPLGFLADRIRNRGYVLIGSTFFIYLTYTFMLYVETNSELRSSTIIPWIPVFLLGVCVAIFCAIVVPTVPMICPPESLGTGFGLMEILQNIALASLPLISGELRQTQKHGENVHLEELKGFHLQTMFFYLLACLCVACAIFLEAADRFRGNKLRKKDFRATYIAKIMRQ